MTAPHQNLLGTSGAVDTEETDPNFNQTVLLLHGDGTNGGQNNTFVDSSSSGRSITRSGNPTQGTFNPFLGDGYYSVYGDNATTDFIQFPLASVKALGTGNFTIEFFVYLTIDTSSDDWRPFFGASNGGGSNPKFNLHDGGSSVISLENASGTLFSTGNVRSQYTHQWCHIAVVREGTGTNQTHIYVNGSKEGTGTFSDDLNGLTGGAFRIGRNPENHEESLDGYISNFKMTASALYSGASFTVPSSPLTLTSQGSSASNVKLLCHQSNRFVDNSNNGHVASVGAEANGTITQPKVVPLSPFAPNASYSESVHGGSGYFDGSGDFLTIPSSSDFVFGTGQFTIECWVYYASQDFGQDNAIIGQVTGGGGFGVLGSVFQLNNDGYFQYYDNNGGSLIVGTSAPNKFEWNHVVVQRDASNNVDLFVNGIRQKNESSTTNLQGFNRDVTIHAWHGGATDNASYYSSMRIVKGASIYTSGSSITVPTAPFTADSDTKLLLNFTNASIIDHTMRNHVETVNDAQIDTTVKKFGTGSIEVDGTDCIRIGFSNLITKTLHLGTGPFTIEMFVYFNGNPNAGGTNARASLARDGGDALVIQRYDGEWEVGNDGNPLNGIEVAQSISNQVFYHVAITRDASNNLRLFIDGTQAGTTKASFTVNYVENAYHFGSFANDGTGGTNGDRSLTGMLDEIRITKGIARYTSNFTAPTKAFANR